MTVGLRGTGHTVLASADSEAFSSLRRRPTSRKERKAMGKALRDEVPRSSLGSWEVPFGRPDPIQLIMDSHECQVTERIPIRVGRIAKRPYGFLRGTAIVMAVDVARLQATGIMP